MVNGVRQLKVPSHQAIEKKTLRMQYLGLAGVGIDTRLLKKDKV